MNIDILTLFPEMFSCFLNQSIVSIAIKNKALNVRLIDIRDFSFNKHRKVDDYPYGGGPGMVMKPEPIFRAVKFLKKDKDKKVIYFTPQGKLLNQSIINSYQNARDLILLCGHYKEIDQRVRDELVDEEFSMGDYVLSGGELPAMSFIDAVARLQKGVLNNIDSALTDSHQNKLLGSPQYTRPVEYKGLKVPDVLTSGNHKKIEEWRLKKMESTTKKIRPDLINE